MNAQNLIAGLLILLALLYVGSTALKKIKSFSPKTSGCGSDCGCGEKSAASKNSFVHIRK